MGRLNRIKSCAGGLAVGLAVLLLSGRLPARPAPAGPQEGSDTPREEVVANLDAGRVIVAVVKDAIIVGTIESPIEAETRPPIPVQLSSERMGVTLGAIDWFSPSSNQDLASIDLELPHLRSHLIASGPHLSQAQVGGEASDIEDIGQGVMERLNQVAHGLNSKLDLPGGEPLAELIVADYLTGYGPEVWQLTYDLEQEQQKGDYWDTRVLRPKYLQFWPPEKGQPHTLMEFAYPPGEAGPTLLELLRQKDPRVDGVMADPAMAQVANEFLSGDSKKIRAQEAIQFLRATLAAITPRNARETFATIGPETGFAWVLPPPPEPKRPGQAARPQESPEGAPSLIKHPD
jgi:hypothetical protein